MKAGQALINLGEGCQGVGCGCMLLIGGIIFLGALFAMGV